MPKYYLISGNQYHIVKDMFCAELSKKIIELKKTRIQKKGYTHTQDYYLIYNKLNDDISWWLNYSQVPQILSIPN